MTTSVSSSVDILLGATHEYWFRQLIAADGALIDDQTWSAESSISARLTSLKFCSGCKAMLRTIGAMLPGGRPDVMRIGTEGLATQ